MPRRPPAATAATDEPKDAAELLQDLGEVFQSAGPGALLYLFRTWPRPPGARQEAFLEKYDGEAPTFEDIRQTFGGGGYRLRMLHDGKRTKHSIAFHIEGAPRFRDADGAAPAGAEETRLDRLESLVAELAGGDQDDEREFRRMMNRAIVARSIGEALRESSPVQDLRGMLGLLRELREHDAPQETNVEGGPWWGALAARALDLMERPPARPAPAPHAGPPAPALPPGEATLPAPGESRELDAFLALLARELDANATAERLTEVVIGLGDDTVSEWLKVDPETWSGFLRAAAARYPVLGTMVARARLGEVLRRLHARAAQQRAEKNGQE